MGEGLEKVKCNDVRAATETDALRSRVLEARGDQRVPAGEHLGVYECCQMRRQPEA
jgi:hypothetical protein